MAIESAEEIVGVAPVDMNVAILAAALIRVFEGLRLTAYQDSGGVWTIGFGHTGPSVIAGLVITEDLAAEYLAQDAAPLLALVKDEPLVAGAAYVSFGYNCGYHSLQMVLEGQAQLEHFVHDRHGNAQPGLVNRRALEAALIVSVAPITA